jgi:hypothetical protein
VCADHAFLVAMGIAIFGHKLHASSTAWWPSLL